MHPYYADGATGRFLGIWISVRYAVFTVGGPAFLALSAGEISNPRRTIPRVAKLIVWRVCGLYVMGAFAVGIMCPSRDPAYLEAVNNGEPGAGSSPWVFGIRKLGITTVLPDAINFMVLLSGLSCGNTFLYTASRSLYSLAQNGQAPRVFLKCSKRGIPYIAGECWNIRMVFFEFCDMLTLFRPSAVRHTSILRLFPRHLQQRTSSIRLVRRPHKRRSHHQRNSDLRRGCTLASRNCRTKDFLRLPSLQVTFGALYRLLGHCNRYLHHHDLGLRHVRTVGHERFHHFVLRRWVFSRAVYRMESMAQDEVCSIGEGGHLDWQSGDRRGMSCVGERRGEGA